MNRFNNGIGKYFYNKGEGNAILSDLYGERVFILAILTLFFSLLDAFLTLILIDHGAIELNPLMSFYLDIGPATFVAVKYGMTALSIFVLVVCCYDPNNSLKIKFPSLFLIIFLAVAAVIPWHLYLLYLHLS